MTSSALCITAGFLLLMATTLLATAIVRPLIHALLTLFASFPFHRVFNRIGQFFGEFTHPFESVDAFVALLLVDILRALVRERCRHVATCIGLPAGFIACIVLLKKISVRAADDSMGFLINPLDGIVGWLVTLAAAIVVTCLIVPSVQLPGTARR